MEKLLRKIIIPALLVLFLAPHLVFADGMIMPPKDRYVSESQQKAAVFYDQGKEDLFLSISFKSDAEHFGWVVPAPNKPEVKKAPDDIFTKLAQFTQAKDKLYDRVIEWFFARGYGSSYGGGALAPTINGTVGALPEAPAKKPTVQVVDEKQVGAFDTVTLKAENVEDLYKWFKEHEYQIPTSGEDVLKEYIEKKWYFVAMKVSGDFLTSKTTTDLKSGAVSPIHLSFKSDKMIYPLKISSINSGKSYDSLSKSEISAYKNSLASEIEGNILKGTAYDNTVLGKAKITGFSEAEYNELVSLYSTMGSGPTNSSVRTNINLTPKINEKVNNLSDEEIKKAAPFLDKDNNTSSGYYYDYYRPSLTIYIFSNKKNEAANYNGKVSYAESLSKGEVNSISEDQNWVKVDKEYYLTKIDVSSIAPGDMKADMLFKDASNNEEVNSGQMSFIEWLMTIGMIFLLVIYFPVTFFITRFPLIPLVYVVGMGIFGIVMTVLQFLGRTKRDYLVLALQAYVLFPVYLFSVFYGAYSQSYYFAYSGSLVDSVAGETGLFFLAFLLALGTSIILYYWAKRVNRNRKTKEQAGIGMENMSEKVQEQQKEIQELQEKIEEQEKVEPKK